MHAAGTARMSDVGNGLESHDSDAIPRGTLGAQTQGREGEEVPNSALAPHGHLVRHDCSLSCSITDVSGTNSPLFHSLTGGRNHIIRWSGPTDDRVTASSPRVRPAGPEPRATPVPAEGAVTRAAPLRPRHRDPGSACRSTAVAAPTAVRPGWRPGPGGGGSRRLTGCGGVEPVEESEDGEQDDDAEEGVQV